MKPCGCAVNLLRGAASAPYTARRRKAIIVRVSSAASTVRVRIRYLSAVREKTAKSLDELTLPAGSTLATVSDWLHARYGLEVPGPSLMSTINGFGWNQVPRGMAAEIHDSDEIALFPLLSGG